MPFYSDEIVSEVRSRNDIVDVVGRVAHLVKKGSNYFCCCPFHNEKTPSMSVSPSKQIYYCFGCHAGGDVISFVSRSRNITFGEAIRELAEESGVALPQKEMSTAEKRVSEDKKRVLEIYKAAAVFYVKKLFDKEGEPARRYIESRKLSVDTVKKFGIGFTGREQDGLYRHIKSLGYEDEILKKSMLFNFDEKKGPSDRFWNRVMFPIMDKNSRVIAFGGRVMGDAKPKYINSTETIIYEKNRHLFGLNYARSSRSDRLILCEGYVDVIALHQAGFDYAVASLGTALTENQARLIGNHVKEVVLSYDSDGAGINAALRAIPILKRQGLSVSVLSMAPYKDPDEFIKGLGKEEYLKRIENAEDEFDFRVRQLAAGFDLSKKRDKALFSQQVATWLGEYESRVTREIYEKDFARKYDIDLRALETEVLREGERQRIENETRQVHEEDRAARKALSRAEDGYTATARYLISWVSESPEFFNKMKNLLTPEDFPDEFSIDIAKEVFASYERLGNVSPAAILSRYEEENEQNAAAAYFAADLMIPMEEKERERAFYEACGKIKRESLSRRSAKASSENDLAAWQQCRNELAELEKLLKKK